MFVGEDPLVEESRTCSAWCPPGQDVYLAGTRKAFGAPAYWAPAAATTEYVDPTPGAKLVTIQVIKTEAGYGAVVAGTHVTPVVPPGGAPPYYPVRVHRGMSEDFETQTHVFSPCAVTLFVEDGQRPPERVRVVMVQQATRHDAQDAVGDPVVMGDAALEATSMSSHTAHVVLAAYPTTFPRVPRVVIHDLTAGLKYNQAKSDAVTWAWLANQSPVLYETMTAAWTAFTGKPGEKPTVPEGLDDTPGFFFASERAQAQAKIDEEYAKVEANYGAAWETATTGAGYLVMNFFPVLLAHAGISLGFSPAFMAIVPQVATIFSLNRQRDGESRSDWFDRLAPQLLTPLLTAIKDHFTQRPRPKNKKVHMTIGEFARILETIASTPSMDDKDLATLQQERRFEQEVLVFRWLTEDESQPLSGLWDKIIKGVVDPRPDRTRNVLNPIDISELERLPTVALETRLRVLIDDSARCDATERVEFEFACDRDDAATLGQISAGLIQDVMRLRRAIYKLQNAVNDAIANSSILAGGKYWFDFFFYAPAIEITKRAFKSAYNDPANLGRDKVIENKLYLLQRIRDRLSEKLSEKFCTPESAGGKLLEKLWHHDGLQHPEDGVERPFQNHWVRCFPHRLQTGPYAFFSSEALSLEYAEVETGAVFVREASAFDDAGKALNRAMVSGRTALQRLMREWEPTNRCKMVVVTQQPPTLASLPIPMAPPNSYDLVIMLPADVRFWVAAKTVEEDLELRLQLQCNRLARKHTNRIEPSQTLLEKLHLPGAAEPEFAAVSLYAELWTDELVALHEIFTNEELAGQAVSTLQSASKRAAKRARDAGDFVLLTTQHDWTGFFADDDPAMHATRAGRDALRLCKRMHLQMPLNRRMVAHLRRVAQALLETANKTLHSDVPFSNLPAEPLASLFLHPRTAGEQAHARVGFAARSLAIANPQAATLAVNAAAAAYPAVLLLDDAAPPAAFEIDEQPQEAPDDADAMTKLEKRAAALRVDYTSTTQLANSAPSVAELTQELVKLSTQEPSKLFYAPFGHGAAPPPLLYPAPACPMFGSVPIWTAHIGDAASRVHLLAPAPAPTTWTLRLQAVVHCAAHEELLPNPHFVVLEQLTAQDRTCYFWASAETPAPQAAGPRRALQTAARPVAARPARGAAGAHTFLEAAQQQASSAQTIVWNAERVAQCLCLASGEHGSAPTRLELHLPTPPPPPERGVDRKRQQRREQELEAMKFALATAIDAHLQYFEQTLIAAQRNKALAKRNLPAPPQIRDAAGALDLDALIRVAEGIDAYEQQQGWDYVLLMGLPADQQHIRDFLAVPANLEPLQRSRTHMTAMLGRFRALRADANAAVLQRQRQQTDAHDAHVKRFKRQLVLSCVLGVGMARSALGNVAPVHLQVAPDASGIDDAPTRAATRTSVDALEGAMNDAAATRVSALRLSEAAVITYACLS